MRVVRSPDELLEQIELAQSESKKAFGKDEVFIEKFLEDAAHIEVQILGDKHGNIVHLFERDCSLQQCAVDSVYSRSADRSLGRLSDELERNDGRRCQHCVQR